MEWCRAGLGIGKYNAESPKHLKTGQQRFNSITKTIHFAYLGILFIYEYGTAPHGGGWGGGGRHLVTGYSIFFDQKWAS